MLSTLYYIIIFPLYAFFELIFHFLVTHSTLGIIGIIFFISLIVNILCAPLYIRADILQNEEDELQKKMKWRVDSIKKNFKGDEKYLLLSAYYRENNYNPIMALRNYYSLLLQIPIFIAAFLFFSQLDILKFFPANTVNFDFTKPDALLKIGSITINILPIVMTIFNCIAALIYSSKHKYANKLEMWIIPILFLALLYNQPAILLIYWTFNNFISMLKNIFLCYFNENLNKKIYFSLISICIIYFLFISSASLLVFISILLLLLVLILAKRKILNFLNNIFDDKTTPVFLLFSFCLAIFIGLYIPSCTLSGSPLDLPSVKPFNNTIPFLLNSFMQSIGIFIFWGGILYSFASKSIQKLFSFTLIFLFAWSILNFITVDYPNSVLNPDCTFIITSGTSALNLFHQIFNLILFLIISGIIILLLQKHKKLFIQFIFVFGLVLLSCSILNAFNIIKTFYINNKNIAEKALYLKKEINLSKNKNNVLIIILDRAISSYIPVIFKEIPDLKKSYQGFTFYPNTISYAGSTIYSFPSMLGGYEYTPDKWFYYYTHGKLDEKYKESQFVLPELLSRQGYDITLADIPFSEYYYSIISKEDFRNKNFKHLKLKEKYGDLYIKNFFNNNKYTMYINLLNRNLLYYSFLKVLPPSMRLAIYNNGQYLNSKNVKKYVYFATTFHNYAELYYLPELTDFSSKKPTFNLIVNELTHDPALLTKPDYNFFNNDIKNNKTYTKTKNVTQEDYDVNAAALILTGKYLDYLKANGIYDNTRIIIASDHGCPYYVDTPYSEKTTKNILNYNPVLMIKDFNSNEKFSVKNEFHTLADIPQFTLKNIIKNPVNPYTNKSLIAPTPKETTILMHINGYWQKEQFRTNPKFYLKHATFRTVKNDIFDDKNWGEIMDYKTVENSGYIKP